MNPSPPPTSTPPMPTPSPTVAPPPGMATTATPSVDQASTHLEQRLDTRWHDMLSALDNRNFYTELFLVVLAIALAALVSTTICQRIKTRLKASPPKFIDAEFLIKPLSLLFPTFGIVFLWCIQQVYALSPTMSSTSGGFVNGVLELSYAYWLTQCVFMVIRFRPVAIIVSATIIIDAILRTLRVAHSTSTFFNAIEFDVGPYHLTALHLVHGFIIFVVVFWGAGLLSRTLESYLRRSTHLTPTTRHLAVKFFRILFYVCAFFVTLSAIGIDITAFAIFGGALGVGIGLGLQKLTGNFVSGVTVMMERSINIGDLIEVNGSTGWVRELNIRYALIETFDGREILVPNEELVSSRVINWTLTTTMARIEIKVTVAFDSDPEKTKELLLEAAREHPQCLKEPAPTCWLTEFTDHGPLFMLGFWIPDVKAGILVHKSEVMFALLKKFQQHNILLAHA